MPVDRRCGTRAGARARVEADDLPQPARLADRALERDLGAERRGVTTSATRPGGQSRRVSRWNGSMSHASNCDRPVVVELEPVARRGQRLPRPPTLCARAEERAVGRELGAQVRVLEHEPGRRIDASPGVDDSRRAVPGASTTTSSPAGSRRPRAAPRRSCSPACPPLPQSAASPRRPRRGRARRPRRRAGSTSPAGCRGTGSGAGASRAGRAPPRVRPPPRRQAEELGVVQRLLGAAVAALRPRLRRVRAAVVLEVELADDDRPLARLGLERLEELVAVPHLVRGSPCRSRARRIVSSISASGRRRRRRGRRRAGSCGERSWSW